MRDDDHGRAALGKVAHHVQHLAPRPTPGRERIDNSGTVTLRVHGQLRQIGIGRTHARTHVILLIQDLNVRVIDAIAGELLHELTINTSKDYQPRK